jgi:transcriptional regulator with XRE-family HTH domain
MSMGYKPLRRPRSPKPKRRPSATLTAQLRDQLGVSRPVLARLLGLSERTLGDLERGGRSASDSARRRLAEADRLYRKLCRVIKPHAVGPWLVTPNKSFGGFKPLELIERGESDRLWHMIYELEAGDAF